MYKVPLVQKTIDSPVMAYIVINKPSRPVVSVWDMVTIEIPLPKMMELREQENIQYAQKVMDHDPDRTLFNPYSEVYTVLGENMAYAQDLAGLEICEHLSDLFDLSTLSLDELRQIDADLGGQWWDGDTDVSERPEIYGEEYLTAQSELDHLRQIIAEREQPIIKKVTSGKPGYVYLLRSVSGHWKIGRTSNPSNRMKTFGIQLPFEVEFEHLIPTDNMCEGETTLHARFADKRVNGEWFNLTPEDVEYIKSITRM